MRIVPFRYANPNPVGRHTNDCVIRAIALATGRTWDDVYKDIADKGLELADTMEANSTWGTYLKEIGFTQHIVPSICRNCYTVKDFCMDFPSGDYILATGSHVLYCNGLDYFDTSDSGDDIITYYFRKDG